MKTHLFFSRGQDGVLKAVISRKRNDRFLKKICLAYTKRMFFEAWQTEGPCRRRARPGTARLGLASGDDASDIRRCRKRNMEGHTLKSITLMMDAIFSRSRNCNAFRRRGMTFFSRSQKCVVPLGHPACGHP